MADRAVIGVVIPAFGHPRYLAEAIHSALMQDIDADVHVLVVDDGCRFDETRQVTLNLMGEAGGRLHYLRQANTRLPGARNTGVRFFLTRFPDFDSLFFLDADNRLTAYSLRRYRQALGDNDRIGWAYPDIGFFGMAPTLTGLDVRETAPTYQKIRHLMGNVSEAGSLVRGDVFRAGVRYDETLTQGLEDWDFWLSCLEAGFDGVRAANTGFHYRKRPESMLAEAQRDYDAILWRVRDNHPTLFHRDRILETRHKEAPAFAVLPVDEHGQAESLALFLDPKAGHTSISRADFVLTMKAKQASPAEYLLPDRLIVLPRTDWDKLQTEPFLLRLRFRDMWRASGLKALDFGASRVGILVDKGTLVALAAGRAQMPKATPQRLVTTALDRSDPASDADYGVPLQALEALIMDGAERRPSAGHKNRRYGGPNLDVGLEMLMTDVVESEEAWVLPRLMDPKGTLVVVGAADLVQKNRLGDVENLVDRLVQSGRSVSLMVERPNADYAFDLSQSLQDSLDDVLTLTLEDGTASEIRYLGRTLPVHISGSVLLDAVRMIPSYQQVIVSATAAAIEVLGDARRWGRDTAVLASPSFVEKAADRELATGRILAFEHAVSRVIDPGHDFGAGLSAAGLPDPKRVTLDEYLTPAFDVDALADEAPWPAPPAPPAVHAPVKAPELPRFWRPRRGFVFLITYGRSGSTVLQRIIGSMPGTCFRGENMGIVEPLQKMVLTMQGAEQLVDYSRSIPSRGPWFGADNFNTRGLTRDLVDVFLRQVIKPPPGVDRIGFKEIRHSHQDRRSFFELMDFMATAFEGARFVFNTRTVDAVAQSSWWKDTAFEDVKALVDRADANFEAYTNAYPDRCLMIDYNDYAQNLDGLEPLYAFLGERFDRQQARAILDRKLVH